MKKQKQKQIKKNQQTFTVVRLASIMRMHREMANVNKKAIYEGFVTPHTFEHMEQGTLRYLDRFLAIIEGYRYALPPVQYRRMILELFGCEE